MVEVSVRVKRVHVGLLCFIILQPHLEHNVQHGRSVLLINFSLKLCWLVPSVGTRKALEKKLVSVLCVFQICVSQRVLKHRGMLVDAGPSVCTRSRVCMWFRICASSAAARDPGDRPV